VIKTVKGSRTRAMGQKLNDVVSRSYELDGRGMSIALEDDPKEDPA
jgi:hypothetical protein